MNRPLPKLDVIGARVAIALAINNRDTEAATMARTRDISVPGPHGHLNARLYRPKATRASEPTLLFMHGGGFVHCDLDSHDALCRRLAAASGLRILSVDYRLAPEHAFPTQVEDGETAIRWMLGRLKAKGDRVKLLIGGDSAGAYIVLSAIARLDQADLDRVAGQALIYPLLQLDDASWASSRFEDARLIGRMAVHYIRDSLKPGDLAIPSLLDVATLRKLPTLVATGGPLDPCRPDARTYAAQLVGLGAKVELLGFTPLIHGFGNHTHMSPRARRAVADIGQAIRRLLP